MIAKIAAGTFIGSLLLVALLMLSLSFSAGCNRRIVPGDGIWFDGIEVDTVQTHQLKDK